VETRDGEATEDDNLKASDADRQQVADRLGTAVGEGRLTLQEYRDRAGQTCAARTHGESPPSDTRTIHPPAWLDGYVHGAGVGVVGHLES
jgi:hypothetical protein